MVPGLVPMILLINLDYRPVIIMGTRKISLLLNQLILEMGKLIIIQEAVIIDYMGKEILEILVALQEIGLDIIVTRQIEMGYRTKECLLVIEQGLILDYPRV